MLLLLNAGVTHPVAALLPPAPRPATAASPPSLPYRAWAPERLEGATYCPTLGGHGSQQAVEAMMRSRPKPGERRIDAAIDHLVEYGFPRPQTRKTINDLLKLYGKDGWVFLEEGSYRVVLDKLLEEQDQQDQKKEATAAEDAPTENDMEVSLVHDEAPNESASALEPQASPSSSPPLEH